MKIIPRLYKIWNFKHFKTFSGEIRFFHLRLFYRVVADYESWGEHLFSSPSKNGRTPSKAGSKASRCDGMACFHFPASDSFIQRQRDRSSACVSIVCQVRYYSFLWDFQTSSHGIYNPLVCLHQNRHSSMFSYQVFCTLLYP